MLQLLLLWQYFEEVHARLLPYSIVKLKATSIVAALAAHVTSRRLFITDRFTDGKFLINACSDVSFLPKVGKNSFKDNLICS